MKTNKLFPLLILTISFALVGCSQNNLSSSLSSSNSSSSVSSSSSTTTSIGDEIIYTLSNIETKLRPLISDYNHVEYQTTQIDNYYGIDIDTYQSGEITVYQDYFYQDNFTQQIGEDNDTYNGTNERGIYNDCVYDITTFDASINDPIVNCYNQVDDSDFLNYFFSVDFVTLYIVDVIQSSYNTYIANEGINCELTTNILDLDLNSDGEKTLEFDIQFKQGTSILFEFYRNDKIIIDNGTIISSESNYFQSINDSVNYQSVSTIKTYSNVNDVYSGIKIDPSLYL